MRLSKYLDDNEISDAAFADLIGVSRQAVYRYRNGRVPDAKTMADIISKTKGAVTANDFFSIPATSRRDGAAA